MLKLEAVLKSVLCLAVAAVCSTMLAAPLLAAPRSVPFDRPLVFEPNRGQMAPEVKWTARGRGYQVLVTADSAPLMLWEGGGQAAPRHEGGPIPAARRHASPDARVTVLSTKLNGSRPWNATGLEPTGGHSNYFVGNDPSRWRENVPHYAKLRVPDVYPGVDLVFYGNDGRLEYDLIVAPGADPRQIRLAFSGPRGLRIDDETGDLLMSTPSGAELRTHRPKVYQEVGDYRVEVASAYDLSGHAEVRFTLASYDTTRPLVIDPTITFTTFLEGSALDDAKGIAPDPSGNSYVVGSTLSGDFPGFHDLPTKSCTPTVTVPNGLCGFLAFVTKLSPTGSILFSTFLGGSGDDFANGVAADASGVYVAGGTTSPDFPVFFSTFRGCRSTSSCPSDAFVVKLSPDGTQMIYSTLFGGSAYDEAFAIAVDATQSVYVGGGTASTDFPVSSLDFPATNLPLQTTLAGGEDGFVTKLNPRGFLYDGFSTYLGGSLDDEIDGIAVDRGGFVYATGFTFSTNFPTVGPVYGRPTGNGTFTAFVSKVVPNGSGFLYSLTLGGGFDLGFAITTDAGGVAYVTGKTASANFPTTLGAFQPAKPSPVTFGANGPLLFDAFVAVISPGGLRRYATYLGGTTGFGSVGRGIAVNSQGAIYVGGYTFATDFPGPTPDFTPNPTAGFLAKFDPTLSTLQFRIFLGAEVHSVAIPGPASNRFSIIISSVLPVTTQIYTAGLRFRPFSDVSQANNVDAFVVKVQDSPLAGVFAP